MPRYLSVLKLTGTVNWRNGTTGAYTPLQSCQSFNTATSTTAQFRLQSPDASVELHQFDDASGSPFCPTPHKGRTLLMVLNRDASNLKKRRANLTPKSRKVAGPQGKKRHLKRNPNYQVVESGSVVLEIRT
ncbi:hypothetical protein [Prosthecobacter sp.]|uniref:hypothetical protein n=1 Tax=Prosthecobacter sp. TaxID=1965333 RepID=UPI001DDA56A8|nr:hypothetical protein [Prosthecobacter sp.]MCB1275938.1 hypothetical protein [Prosthecobacter sp.]